MAVPPAATVDARRQPPAGRRHADRRRADAAATGRVPGDPWRRTLRRTPRAVPRWDPAPIPCPVAAPVGAGAASGRRPAPVVTCSASVVVAVVMRSRCSSLFGAVGARRRRSACGSPGGSARRTTVARRRPPRDARRAPRSPRRVERAAAARWRHHVATTPSVAEAIAAATTVAADLWARRADHDDAFRRDARLGPVEWEVAVDGAGGTAPPATCGALVAAARPLRDAAVPFDLAPAPALAIVGPRRAGRRPLARRPARRGSGPADWRLVVVVDDGAPGTGPPGSRTPSAGRARAS